MKITILTLFDNIYHEFINSSIIKRARENKNVSINVVNFREYSKDKNKKVDDYQFGGGAGMVLQLQPIVDCLKTIASKDAHIILTTPRAKVYNQDKAIELSKKKEIVIIAGHYEGFDERINNYVDEHISIGDYVLTGGELASLVILDSVTRLVPGVINESSLESESFNNNLLDYPVYTKPVDFEGYKVPEVLLSGNHQKIKEYRLEQQIKITKEIRPDLYEKYKKKGNNDEN